MKLILAVLAAALAASSASTLAAEALPQNPEEAIPADLPRMTSPGPYEDLFSQVQDRLNQLGFDAGPVNGDFGPKTQAALAQFQLAQLLPASGMPDAATLHELGIQASGGESAARP